MLEEANWNLVLRALSQQKQEKDAQGSNIRPKILCRKEAARLQGPYLPRKSHYLLAPLLQGLCDVSNSSYRPEFL